MLNTLRTVLALYAVVAVLGLGYFLSRAGRWPEGGGEWAGLALGSAFLLALIATIAAARAAAR